jgi:ribosomal protein L17
LAARKNPGGGKGQDKLWSDALRLAVNEASADGDGKKLRALANKLVEKGLEGDVSALREIGDRLDGKPTQAIAGVPDQPLVHKIVREIVGTKNTNG